MKTTLNIDDAVMAELKREAASQGRTISELVESALRGSFHAQRQRVELPDLPTAGRSWRSLIEMRCIRPWKGVSPGRSLE